MKNNIITPIYNKNGIFLRKNRSFVCRTRRIAQSQFQLIKDNWFSVGINFQSKLLNLLSIFQRHAPIVLEIGFGSGESLINTAINHPDKNFLGVEVYKSGIISCLRYIKSYKINNLKIIYHDAVEVVDNMIPDNTILKVQMFFPDPWNKKRHHKRRIIKNSFLKKILNKLTLNGILHIVTDSKNYADDILNIIKLITNYEKLSTYNTYIHDFISCPTTKFKKKANLLGNKIFNLVFVAKK